MELICKKLTTLNQYHRQHNQEKLRLIIDEDGSGMLLDVDGVFFGEFQTIKQLHNILDTNIDTWQEFHMRVANV